MVDITPLLLMTGKWRLCGLGFLRFWLVGEGDGLLIGDESNFNKCWESGVSSGSECYHCLQLQFKRRFSFNWLLDYKSYWKSLGVWFQVKSNINSQIEKIKNKERGKCKINILSNANNSAKSYDSWNWKHSMNKTFD